MLRVRVRQTQFSGVAAPSHRGDRRLQRIVEGRLFCMISKATYGRFCYSVSVLAQGYGGGLPEKRHTRVRGLVSRPFGKKSRISRIGWLLFMEPTVLNSLLSMPLLLFV